MKNCSSHTNIIFAQEGKKFWLKVESDNRSFTVWRLVGKCVFTRQKTQKKSLIRFSVSKWKLSEIMIKFIIIFLHKLTLSNSNTQLWKRPLHACFRHFLSLFFGSKIWHTFWPSVICSKMFLVSTLQENTELRRWSQRGNLRHVRGIMTWPYMKSASLPHHQKSDIIKKAFRGWRRDTQNSLQDT